MNRLTLISLSVALLTVITLPAQQVDLSLEGALLLDGRHVAEPGDQLALVTVMPEWCFQFTILAVIGHDDGTLDWSRAVPLVKGPWMDGADQILETSAPKELAGLTLGLVGVYYGVDGELVASQVITLEVRAPAPPSEDHAAVTAFHPDRDLDRDGQVDASDTERPADRPAVREDVTTLERRPSRDVDGAFVEERRRR